MFATSTALHDEAVKALTAPDRVGGLLSFEDHLLDRGRPWPGTGGQTLTDLGYGHLGAYTRHVKEQTNLLITLARHTCVDDPLTTWLIPTALSYGRDHKGMPGWATIVKRIAVLLTEPDHPTWPDPESAVRALRDLPPHTLPIEQLTTRLLAAPATLPEPTLRWLSNISCTAPPRLTATPSTLPDHNRPASSVGALPCCRLAGRSQ